MLVIIDWLHIKCLISCTDIMFTSELVFTANLGPDLQKKGLPHASILLTLTFHNFRLVKAIELKFF